MIFDHRRCSLGESPLWHPELQTLFWVDILERAVLWRGWAGAGQATFERPVSALALADNGNLILADDASISLWSHLSGRIKTLMPLEDALVSNRANDGRADPWGGFWIGTMDRGGTVPSGTIYRWSRGKLCRIIDSLSIPNGLCFDRDRQRAYFTDTPTHRIMRLVCDDEGWPLGSPQLHIDLSDERILVDGATTDRYGHIRAACWDKSEIITISPEGDILGHTAIPTQRPTSVAFAGRNLFVTSAAIGLEADAQSGKTFRLEDRIGGNPEPRVVVSNLD